MTESTFQAMLSNTEEINNLIGIQSNSTNHDELFY